MSDLSRPSAVFELLFMRRKTPEQRYAENFDKIRWGRKARVRGPAKGGDRPEPATLNAGDPVTQRRG